MMIKFSPKMAASTLAAVAVFSCKTSHPDVSQSATSSAKDDPAAAALEEDISFIKGEAAATVKAMHSKLGNPASRHFHPKGFCAKGMFIVDPDATQTPSMARLGPFGKKTIYPMFGRFSNGAPHRLMDDRVPSVFGFGIKVLGVSSNKFVIPGTTKPVNSNQDWNLATGPTFPIPTAAVYREQRVASADPAKMEEFAAKYPKVLADLLAARSNLDTYAASSYHSQIALHFGEDHIAKFSVAPCDGVERTITPEEAATRTHDYLLDDIRQRLKTEGACFVFRAQIRPADHKLTASQADWAQRFPAANPTVEWSTSEIPFVTLARIEIPAQENVEDLQPTCEALSINPGNTLQALRPIESDTLMASRIRGAYEGSVSTRTALNHLIQSEPDAPAIKQQRDLDEWIHAVR